MREKNCEDILFNYVAATAIQESLHQGQQPQQKQQPGAAAGLPPHAVWSQPSRRLDISFLSGVGISKSGHVHEGARGEVAQLPGPLMPSPIGVLTAPDRLQHVSKAWRALVLSPAAAKRRRCVQLFSEWYGDILRPRPVQWDRQGALWRLLLRPVCWLPTGCLYL